MLVENGQMIDFWEDPWCGVVSLKDKLKGLYDICTEQNRSVAEMAERGWRMNFRRWLNERDQKHFSQMRDMLAACALSNEKDRVTWILEKTGNFSVKSMYKHLFSLETSKPNK
jgi:hypothetical protein